MADLPGCVFCGIVAGTVPARIVCRTADAVAFPPLSAGIVAPGHMVVAPTAHDEDLVDASADALSAAIRLVQLVARSCTDGLGADGVNVLHNSGAAAGQSVHHLHFHVIPRWVNDGIDAWPSERSHRDTDTDAYTTLTNWIEDRQRASS